MNDQTNNGSSPSSGARPVKGRLVKTALRVVLTLVLFFAVGTAVVVFLARSEPAYWQTNQQFIHQTSPDQIKSLTQAIQSQLNGLANLGLDEAGVAVNQTDKTKQIAPSQKDVDQAQPGVKPENVHINAEQTVTLNNEQLAAWVQTHTDRWMEDRGYVKPQEITDPMVAVDDGQLVMAFALDAGGFSSVISGKFSLTMLDNGMASLTMKTFQVGKLPVPAIAIAEFLRTQTQGDPRAVKVGQWLEKLQHLEFKPVLELDHRRRARVMDYKLLDDSLELTVRVQDHKTYKSMNQALAGVQVD